MCWTTGLRRKSQIFSQEILWLDVSAHISTTRNSQTDKTNVCTSGPASVTGQDQGRGRGRGLSGGQIRTIGFAPQFLTHWWRPPCRSNIDESLQTRSARCWFTAFTISGPITVTVNNQREPVKVVHVLGKTLQTSCVARKRQSRLNVQKSGTGGTTNR